MESVATVYNQKQRHVIKQEAPSIPVPLFYQNGNQSQSSISNKQQSLFDVQNEEQINQMNVVDFSGTQQNIDTSNADHSAHISPAVTKSIDVKQISYQ